MRNFLKVFSGVLVGASLLALPVIARAQELTLRVEPGVAIPVTDPQDQRFHPGAALAVKPEIGLGSYFSVGPSLSLVALPSKLSGVDTGTIMALGGFARLKRPHDERNTGTGWSAVSPWVDVDLQYVRTDPLDRFGAAAAVGASFPTSDARNLWVGPFVRYQGVLQEAAPAINSNNAKILILGVSFELGAKAPKKAEPVEAPPVNVPPPPPPVAETEHPVPPPVVYKEVDVKFRPTIQFAWDSAVLDPHANSQLTEVAKNMSQALTTDSGIKFVKVEGHASSEGQVKHNDILAQKRADAVVNFLVANGVPREKLSATGFGSTVPVASNKTEAGRVLNRRVEFVVTLVVVKESK